MKLMKEFIKENKWIVLATTLTICLQIAGTLGVPKLVGKLIDVGIVSGDQPVSYTHLTLPTKRSMCRSRWSPYH